MEIGPVGQWGQDLVSPKGGIFGGVMGQVMPLISSQVNVVGNLVVVVGGG